MKFPVLVSYAYARRDVRSFRQLIERPDVELLLDCGAFTAKNAGQEIRLDDYCQFLDEWGHKIFRYLALDVVGNPHATDANLHQMLRAGYKPVPVHVLGDDQRRMDELFNVSDYVALAGLRRPHKGGAPKEYVAAKMKWAAGRHVHWLGYVQEPMIAAFQPYSCDSASWASAHMYGRACVYLGKGRWLDAHYKERHKLLQSAEAMRILASLGFSSKDVHDPCCWKGSLKLGYAKNRFLSAVVTTDSWVRYVIDMYRRFSTKVFLATAMPTNTHEVFINALDRHADKLNLDTLYV